MTSRVRRIAAIAGVYLLRLARDRVALFFAFVLPFLIIVLIGSSNPGGDLSVGLVDKGDGPLAQEIATDLRDADGLRIRDYGDVEGLRRAVRRREIVAGLAIPRDYDDTIRNGSAELALVVDRAESDSTAAATRISSIVASQGALTGATRFVTDNAGGDFDARMERVREIDASAPPVRVDVGTAGENGLSNVSIFDYVTYGQLVLFLFLTALTGAGDLVESRRLGVERRILATPTSATTAIAGDAAGHFSVAGAQAFAIVAVGALLLGVSWGDPLGTAALVAMFALVSTGAGLLVGTLVRTNEQATSIGPPVGIVLAMLGGCTWPLEIVPPFMRTVAHLTPHAWAMDAFVDLAGRDAGVGAIVPELTVLAGFAAALLALGRHRLRRAVTG